MEPLETITDFLHYVERHYDNPRALNIKEGGSWKPVPTVQFIAEVKRLALALRRSGIKPGQAVGILSNASPRWTIADLAIIAAGAVTVPTAAMSGLMYLDANDPARVSLE